MVSRARAPKISITEDLKKKLREFSEKVVNETYDRFKYNIQKQKRMIFYGKLGEEIFKHYLSTQGLESSIDYNIYPGTSSIDETDFDVAGNNFYLIFSISPPPTHSQAP